jgi:hypothetical protein
MSKLDWVTFAGAERESKALLASRRLPTPDLPEWVYQGCAHLAIAVALLAFLGSFYPDSMADLRFWLALHGLWPAG